MLLWRGCYEGSYWNYRGMGAPRIVRSCQTLIRERHPSMAFFMESKLNRKEAEKLNNKLGFKNVVWVDYSGEA